MPAEAGVSIGSAPMTGTSACAGVTNGGLAWLDHLLRPNHTLAFPATFP